MKDNKIFKLGDKIVHFGKVFRIFKIKKQKGITGKKEKVIFFGPYFKNKENKSLAYSIPLKSIDKTKIRKPISKKELKNLLEKFLKKSEIETPVDLIQAREELKLNDLCKNVQTLKRLWREKNNELTNFTKSKQDVFRLSIKQLVEEVAFVSGLSPAKAKEKIKKALGKGIKKRQVK